mgnify:FL=1
MLKREHKVSNISSEAIFAIPAMKPSRVIFASIFCFFLMIIDIRYESGSYIRSFSNDILKPITFLTSLPLQTYEKFNLFFSSRINLERKVLSLQEENLKLKATNQLMEKISIDNSKLNALWSSLSIDKERFLISKKSFFSSNEYQPLLVLDINSRQTVKKDSAVVSEQGLAGRVSSVGFSSTEVLLVQDIRSSIPVISSDSSLHATLEGKGLGRNGKLKFISKTAEFSAGERVYTSGLGEIFPDGILVGEVVSVSDPVDSEFLEVEIFFYSDPVNQDYFLIHKNE